MPRADQEDGKPIVVKAIVIGPGKGGKTHWATMAAAAGFNVLYLGGDVGKPTIRNLPIEARRRIYPIHANDTMDGGVKDSRFINTVTDFTTAITFKWNDTQQRVAKKDDPEGDTIWEIRPARMDHTCVLIFDSWTALCESMMTRAAVANSVDMDTASVSEMRNVWQPSGMTASRILQVIKALPCHVIVIAHPDEYEHKIKPAGTTTPIGRIKEGDLILEYVMKIPKSTSRPQSLQMSKNFTDVLWFEINDSGTQRYINARLDAHRISGSTWTDRKSADTDYKFANLVKASGGIIPEGTPPMDHWFCETLQPAPALSVLAPKSKVLDSTSQKPVAGATPPTSPTMNSLFKKS